MKIHFFKPLFAIQKFTFINYAHWDFYSFLIGSFWFSDWKLFFLGRKILFFKRKILFLKGKFFFKRKNFFFPLFKLKIVLHFKNLSFYLEFMIFNIKLHPSKFLTSKFISHHHFLQENITKFRLRERIINYYFNKNHVNNLEKNILQ